MRAGGLWTNTGDMHHCREDVAGDCAPSGVGSFGLVQKRAFGVTVSRQAVAHHAAMDGRTGKA